MGRITVLVLVMLAGQTFPAAASNGPSCAAAVEEVLAEWRAISFSTPAKPAQMRVPNRGRQENSGAEVHYMQQQIRRAAQLCKEGNEVEALRAVGLVYELLRRGGSTRDVNLGAAVPPLAVLNLPALSEAPIASRAINLQNARL